MTSVLRLPVYRRLLAAFALNELAWSVGTLALAVLVYRRTGSALGATAFFICSQVVPAFISPFVAAHLDQRPPRRMLPTLYGVEGVLFGVLAWMTTRFSLVPVLVIVVVDGTFAIIARALARTATVAVLRPLDLLHEGNAVTNAAFSISYMAGPSIGGLVVVAGGTAAALLVNCGLFAAIAVVLATTATLPVPAADREPTKGRLRSALTYVRGDRLQRWLLGLQAGGMIVFTISIPVEVVFAGHTLHAGAGGYGALLSAWGTGAVVGSAIYARWRRRPARVLLGGSGASLAVGFSLMAGAPTIVVAVIGAALGGAGNGIVSMAAKTVLQEYTPQRWMGLITTLNESVSQAAPGIGILLGGVIATIANPRIAFAIAGVGSLGYAVASWIALRPSAMPPRPVQRDQGLADEGGNGLPTAAAAGSPAETPTAGPNRETLVP